MSLDYLGRQRHVMLDMHIPDFDEEFLCRFDAAALVAACARAGADAVMLSTNSMTGLCTWPTRSGRMHPAHRSHARRRLHRHPTCAIASHASPGLPRKLTGAHRWREGKHIVAAATPANWPAVGTRRPLNRQRVLDAALAYVDEHGLAALTMRRLGAHLGVEGMSLYKHVADKEALLDGIVERLWVEVPTPSNSRIGWRRALRELGWGVLDLFRRHPKSAPLLVLREFVNLESLRCYDAYVTVLQRTGFERRGALDAVGTVVGNALGYGLLELRYLGPHSDTAGPVSEVQLIRRVTKSLPADAPDSLIQLAVDLTADCDRDRCFTLAVDTLLDGLAPTSAR